MDITSLEGTVERVTFYNPENGFSVVKLRARGRREPVAVVGTLPAVQPGEVLDLSGQWCTDPVHGAQFRPDGATVRPPSDVGGIARYLGSGLIHQLGPVLAQRIVDTFGAATLAVLDTQPERVREVPGIGAGRARALAAAWGEHRSLRAVSAFLSQHGIDTRFAPRLVAAYGPDAPRVLSANPYRLVAEVPGLGFAAADRLGRDLNVRETSPSRLQAAVHATLLRAAEGGHTRLQRDAIVQSAAALGGVAPELLEAAVTQLSATGVIATASASAEQAAAQTALDGLPLFAGAGGGAPNAAAAPPAPAATRGRLRIYEPSLAALPADAPSPRASPPPPLPTGLGLSALVRAEEALAARLLALNERLSPRPPAVVDAWLAADAGAQALSAAQRAAVRGAAVHSLFVLTGGPGVGKTTAVRVLVRCLRALDRSVALCAPTGKAARRLGEVVGLEARTIHRLLGAGPRGFRHGAREPLPYDVVIVYEASMLDTQLARAVVSAVGRQAQLILVGDADQLPSVGPGQVLRDLLACGAVPAARLETVFRQAAKSHIVQAAHAIRQGQVPTIAPHTALVDGVDCVFVPAPAGRVAEVAAGWAAERLPQLAGLATGDIQVLAPLTRVCQSLNSLLQQRLNPPRGQAERPHGALPLRVGDRVIQTHNNYNLGVFNGDGGVVTAIAPEEVRVDFGDGTPVAYAPADLLDLDHAYCLTVHRGQGSEWPGVVIVASSAHGPMLSRNLLYTALTRARRAAVIVGDEAAIARAVAETRDQNRSTGLGALLTAAKESHGLRV